MFLASNNPKIDMLYNPSNQPTNQPTEIKKRPENEYKKLDLDFFQPMDSNISLEQLVRLTRFP